MSPALTRCENGAVTALLTTFVAARETVLAADDVGDLDMEAGGLAAVPTGLLVKVWLAWGTARVTVALGAGRDEEVTISGRVSTDST